MRRVVTGAASPKQATKASPTKPKRSSVGDTVHRWCLYVERRNEREAQHSLENLKDLIEGRNRQDLWIGCLSADHATAS
jgi:hypothetical protein